jgi:hypothetical protein
LPEGWRDRLVKVQNANTAEPAGEFQFTGWCLDKEDLCAAKLCALREKDQKLRRRTAWGRPRRSGRDRSTPDDGSRAIPPDCRARRRMACLPGISALKA